MKYEAGEKGLRLWDEAGEVEIVIEAVREDIIRVRQAREKVKDMPSFLVEENIREREKPEAVIRERRSSNRPSFKAATSLSTFLFSSKKWRARMTERSPACSRTAAKFSKSAPSLTSARTLLPK